jgi:hypothetical protein
VVLLAYYKGTAYSFLTSKSARLQLITSIILIVIFCSSSKGSFICLEKNGSIIVYSIIIGLFWPAILCAVHLRHFIPLLSLIRLAPRAEKVKDPEGKEEILVEKNRFCWRIIQNLYTI